MKSRSSSSLNQESISGVTTQLRSTPPPAQSNQTKEQYLLLMHYIFLWQWKIRLFQIIKQRKKIPWNDLSNINYSIDLSNNQDGIIYKSCLCLPLAKLSQESPLFLAQDIANIFNQSDTKQDILVNVSGNGWLEFIVGDRLLNLWLNNVNTSNRR